MRLRLDRLAEEEALALPVVGDVDRAGGERSARGEPSRSCAAVDRRPNRRRSATSPPSARSTSLAPEPTWPASPTIWPPRAGEVEPVARCPGPSSRGSRRAGRARRPRAACSSGAPAPPRRASARSARARSSCGRLLGAPMRAVAEDHDPVAELEHLVEPVRDVDDARPCATSVADRGEDALGLGLAEARGRLVEDEHARVAAEQPGDLDQLALADAERLDRRRGRDVPESDALEEPARRVRAARRRVRNGSAGCSRGTRLSATLSAGTRLSSWSTSAMPCACASCGSRSCTAPAGEADLAVVRLDEADQRLHERALARAVVAAEADDGAGAGRRTRRRAAPGSAP